MIRKFGQWIELENIGGIFRAGSFEGIFRAGIFELGTKGSFSCGMRSLDFRIALSFEHAVDLTYTRISLFAFRSLMFTY